MSSYYKLNIEKIKKALTITSAAFVFIISFVILTNVYNSINDSEVSHEQKFLRHLISDHSVNKVSFEFIKINLSPIMYYEKKTDFGLTASINFGLFLLLSIIILYCPIQDKISYAQVFPFTDSFKSPPFRPPKYSA